MPEPEGSGSAWLDFRMGLTIPLKWFGGNLLGASAVCGVAVATGVTGDIAGLFFDRPNSQTEIRLISISI